MEIFHKPEYIKQLNLIESAWGLGAQSPAHWAPPSLATLPSSPHPHFTLGSMQGTSVETEVNAAWFENCSIQEEKT